ncbi:acyl-CoA-binding protein (ACBP)/diazepam binding inhibitor (DBI)/endozepine (EP) [Hanseniaspora osmophila]|uniref:Acyl-CoA-binding protein n=1 Tax=Hanseniaspora osmophila TaxID=56408 RepID=A0A1E5RE22_9ASCO|nr:Acyl-CoA-binding protein [Hanseniaspora osmophila]
MPSQEFEAKVKAVNALSKTPSQDDLLKLYSYYKQATVGDNNKTERPGIFNLKDRYKWDAWEKLKGMTKEQAEEEYIILADELIAKDSA